jgi:hypothetical protein
MREILVVNPRKKAGRSGRKVKTMARAKAKKKAGKKPAKRRKNPRKKRSYGKRAAKRLTSGLSIRSALKDQIPIQMGMLAAQWTAKRFGPEASELDPTTWGWSSYAKGVAGGFAAGMIANAIRPGMGQKVLTGALAHITHRLVRNKLIEMNPTLISQFGEDEEGLYVDDDGTPYAASGGEYLPLDEEHRMLPSGSVMGDSIVPASRLGQLEPVGPLGGGDFSEYARAYRQ